MKLFISLLIILLTSQWEPSFENAKKIAKENHKIILLNFSGSDWCAPCILLRKDYLENETFTKMADENLVMVNADFPRKKKNLGSAELIKRNEALAEQYNKEGNFPLTLLLDPDGKVLKKWIGKPQVTVEKWTVEIKSICDAHK